MFISRDTKTENFQDSNPPPQSERERGMATAEIHDLVLVEESLGNDFEKKFCRLCRTYLSVPYYKANEVDYISTEEIYIHKVCADLPKEVTERVHLPRPCYVCKYVRTHHLSHDTTSAYYDFVVKIRRALKSYPITHQCHPQHPLIPLHEEDESFYCVACKRDAVGISYKCTVCPFHVHQQCVSSRIVKLPFHHHDLKLTYSFIGNRSGKSIYCQICEEDIDEENCAYHCAKCRHFFHIHNCRLTPHFTHDHPLLLVKEEGDDLDSESKDCYGCDLKINVPYYTCIVSANCTKISLHKMCADLPQTMEHPLHSEHYLTLLDTVGFGDAGRMCDICHLPWDGFSYSCGRNSCSNFTVDLMCVMKTLHLEFEFHKHRLVSSHIKPPFTCCACNRDTQGSTYMCTICRLWVHQRCALSPTFMRNYLHPHKLKLIYSPPKNCKHFHCHVCREDIEVGSWAYHCPGCRYFTHIYNCSDPCWEIEGFDYEAALAAAIHLPVANEFVSLGTMCFMDAIHEEEDKGLELKPKDTNGTNTRKMPFTDPDETCHRCSKLLAAPCNNCDLCRYILSKSPALLRDASVIEGYYSAQVDTYENNCDGFSMSFHEDRSIMMMISSSVLPRYVKHDGHDHVLLSTHITEPTWCNACENDVQGYVFRCNICNFTIDSYCALLPGSISHRYDKKHPFKLTYYSVEGVEEYVCEFCEEDITTMWFYHCEECDHSIHPRCIWKTHIEFGARVEHSSHQHGFTMVATTICLPYGCEVCREKMMTTAGCRYSLFCEECSTWLHLECTSDAEMERWPEDSEALDTIAVLMLRRAMNRVSVLPAASSSPSRSEASSSSSPSSSTSSSSLEVPPVQLLLQRR